MRKFQFIKNGKVIEEFEENNEEEAINDVLRWEKIEVVEIFEEEYCDKCSMDMEYDYMGNCRACGLKIKQLERGIKKDE